MNEESQQSRIRRAVKLVMGSLKTGPVPHTEILNRARELKIAKGLHVDAVNAALMLCLRNDQLRFHVEGVGDGEFDIIWAANPDSLVEAAGATCTMLECNACSCGTQWDRGGSLIDHHPGNWVPCKVCRSHGDIVVGLVCPGCCDIIDHPDDIAATQAHETPCVDCFVQYLPMTVVLEEQRPEYPSPQRQFLTETQVLNLLFE